MEIKYFKYNKDDILEILTEMIAKENGFGTFNSYSDLIIDDDKVFFVGAIGKLEDNAVEKVDLNKLYHEMEYNGTHDGKGFSSMENLSEALKRAIEKGDF